MNFISTEIKANRDDICTHCRVVGVKSGARSLQAKCIGHFQSILTFKFSNLKEGGQYAGMDQLQGQSSVQLEAIPGRKNKKTKQPLLLQKQLFFVNNKAYWVSFSNPRLLCSPFVVHASVSANEQKSVSLPKFVFLSVYHACDYSTLFWILFTFFISLFIIPKFTSLLEMFDHFTWVKYLAHRHGEVPLRF